MPTEQLNDHPPLSILSEDEAAFRDAVAEFANGEVRPRVQEMERNAQLDPELIPKYFELGLMGILVPEQYGGAGGTLMMTTICASQLLPVIVC